MQTKETYNRIALEWHKDHQSDDWWVGGTDKFISFLNPGALVLDAGCGGGTKSTYLIKNGLQVVGIDSSEKLIEIAKSEVPECSFLVRDIGDVGDLSYYFDGIFLQAVLLHIPKKEILGKLKNLVSKMKEMGYIYVAVKEKYPNGPEEEIKKENDYGYTYERFFSYFTVDEMRSLFKQAGLKVVYSSVELNGKTNWIQIIGRKPGK